MPFKQLLADLGVLPLRAIISQILLLMVAIALEAGILRQRLRLGYKPSVQYAAALNLLATSLGWITFLNVEPLLPELVRSQIISFIFFNRFFVNSLSENLPILMVIAGIGIFFVAYWIKRLGLEGLLWLMEEKTEKPAVSPELTRQERYERARKGRSKRSVTPVKTLAVLEANALSFSALLGLLLLRQFIEQG